MQQSPKGLIFLNAGNAILKEQLHPRIIEGKREPCEMAFSDFDDVSFKISCLKDTPNVVQVSMQMRQIKELKSMGSQEVIDRLFPGMEVESNDTNYNMSLQFDCDNIPGDPLVFLENISELKRHILGGPMDKAFTALEANKSISSSIMTVRYREKDVMFICPAESKVTVFFYIDFSDQTDKAMAKTFLQEFVEVQRTIRTAPPVTYGKDIPSDLRGLNLSGMGDGAGFISFALEQRHVKGKAKDKAITLLTGFRNYLHYHIKCSKTYLHMRMRKRVAGWLQVLNRAVPVIESEKKTASGKTFSRK